MRHFLLLLFFICFPPLVPAHAQVSLPPIGSLVTLSAESDSFSPGTSVLVTAKSFSFELSRMELRWFQGDALAHGGVGATSAVIRLGEAGEDTQVTVQIFEDSTFITEARATLTPASVDIIWEGSGYVHPFYRGRSLPSSGGFVSAEARPTLLTTDGFVIPNSRLVFDWSLNGNALGSLSGLGKSNVRIPVTDFSSEDILGVSVRSKESLGQATSKVRIPAQKPHLTLYRIDPLLGVDLLNAVSSDDLVGDSEASFTLVPYYLGVNTLRDPSIALRWEVNNTVVEPHSDDPFSLTLVSPSDSVLARIKAVVSTSSFIDTERVWRVLFETPRSSAIRDLFSRPVN